VRELGQGVCRVCRIKRTLQVKLRTNNAMSWNCVVVCRRLSKTSHACFYFRRSQRAATRYGEEQQIKHVSNNQQRKSNSNIEALVLRHRLRFGIDEVLVQRESCWIDADIAPAGRVIEVFFVASFEDRTRCWCSGLARAYRFRCEMKAH